MLRGNGVGFEAFETAFQAPLLLICVHGGPEERETLTGNQVGASTSTEQGAYINPVCIRRSPTRTIWLGEDNLVFVRLASFVRSASSTAKSANFEARQLSKILSLSLLDLRVLAKGLSLTWD